MSKPAAGRRSTALEFEAADGAELIGDLDVPTGAVGAAIVCHPHPQYGGNRHDAVVGAVADALRQVSIATLRFDFRRRFDDGVGERLDALAALDSLAEEVPSVPLLAAGYSFGAMITAALADPRVTAQVLVAPPFGAMGEPAPPPIPTLVLVAAHDQFAPPATVEPIIERWRQAGSDVDMRVIDSADHFLHGRIAAVADHAATWLASHLE